jgi:hypothetical protein
VPPPAQDALSFPKGSFEPRMEASQSDQRIEDGPKITSLRLVSVLEPRWCWMSDQATLMGRWRTVGHSRPITDRPRGCLWSSLSGRAEALGTVRRSTGLPANWRRRQSAAAPHPRPAQVAVPMTLDAWRPLREDRARPARRSRSLRHLPQNRRPDWRVPPIRR